MSLLDKINSPDDIKVIPRTELPLLAKEIRQVIIDVVSKNGGHLASSLGAVELAIAIHYVFDSPNDKIIWDVGHQAYAHKLLTGRRDRFHTLRKHEGISGFTSIKENEHDAFSTGHSGTSISAGLGIACGMRLKNKTSSNSRVVAVIGDGSMTSGMAFEGLNQAGDIHKDLIVILNDNDMSISQNVGALSSFLSRTFSAKKMQALRKEFGEFLKSLPKVGTGIYLFAKRSEESFKSFVTPGMLFEAFNFEYFGPIDGHRLKHLIDILQNIKHLNEPVLLHVITQKGKGYPPAEKNPVYFHGVGSFEVKTGKPGQKKKTSQTYTQVFGDTMVKMAEKDDKIIAVTAAMPEGTGLVEFAKTYPDRFFDTGIAEQHGVTFSAGLALQGFKPVVAIYSTFLQRAYDQIVHDVCLESIPVAFAIDRGGIVGEDGFTHNGLFDFAYLRSLPNMVVMAPKNENELSKMIATAINHQGPIAFRYPRGQGTGVAVDENVTPLDIGKGEVLAKGDDILILAIGRSVIEAMDALEIIRKKGFNATVVNCRFVKPLDADLICSLASGMHRIITVEENVLQGGFGSAVLECLCDNKVTGFSIERIGLPDTFIEHGSQDILRSKYNIDAKAIANTALKLIQEQRK